MYDFLIEGVHAWNSTITTTGLLRGWGDKLEALRLNIKIGGTATLFGLGYIIGLRYSAVIAAGSVLAQVVMVPLVYLLGSQLGAFHYLGQTYDVSQMHTGEIFTLFVRPIGIGAIAVSGLIGLIRMGKKLPDRRVGVARLQGHGTEGSDGERRHAAHAAGSAPEDGDPRPARSMLAMGRSSTWCRRASAVIPLRSRRSSRSSGMPVGFAISFLFTPVAAQAIAIVGTNPVSGMTLITLVVASAIMVGVGLSGKAGMFVALVIGTAVCTALSTSGGLIAPLRRSATGLAPRRATSSGKFVEHRSRRAHGGLRHPADGLELSLPRPGHDHLQHRGAARAAGQHAGGDHQGADVARAAAVSAP